MSTVLCRYGKVYDGFGVKHIGIETAGAYLGNRVLGYTKVAFVRHPVDRLWSLFHYYVQVGQPNMPSTFEQFVKTEGNVPSIQSAMLRSGGRVAADFVGRYERIDTDWKLACLKMGVPHSPLPRENSSTHPDWRGRVGRDTLRRIVDKYGAEFRDFGYEMPV